MQSEATLRHLRIAPRKVRLVAELIRGKKVSEAQTILQFCTKRAAHPIQKILRSALASMEKKTQSNDSNLYVASVAVQEGSKLKRYRPRARGRAYPIEKKTSHITLVLNEIVPSTPVAKQKEIQETLPESSKTTFETEKPKFRPAKEIIKRKSEGGLRRIFRRKTV